VAAGVSLDLLRPPAHLVRRGSGPPVLLLHGWGVSSDLFQATIAGLEGSFSLIAPDFPGFGATPPPPAAWAVGDYTAWVVALLDAAGLDRVHIIAHSFGGRVAIKLASQRPERVDKLVLTACAGIRPARTAGYWARVATYKTLRRLATSPLAPPGLRAWLSRQAGRRGSTDYQQATGTVRASFVRVVNEDLRMALPHIQAPTLLIWGDRDDATPLTDAHLMEQLIPDAGLVVFPGAGHYAYLEQSARFCHIVSTFFRASRLADGGRNRRDAEDAENETRG
jgi:pimeloyl-ACP methyl ester carboxylesterase